MISRSEHTEQRTTRRLLGSAVSLCLMLLLAISVLPAPARAQDTGTPDLIGTVVPDGKEAPPDAPAEVAVEPIAQDTQIASRLESILRATEWFRAPQVTVRDGVVFLVGQTTRQEYKDWAGELGKKTQDVVAVVNRIEVIERSPWDFTPALSEMKRLTQGIVKLLPQLLFGLLTLVLTWQLSKLVVRLARRLLVNSIESPLLRDLGAWLFGVPVFILGLYLILQTLGLTRLALTVLGGTGLAGLVVGIGFSNIVENLLASILISARYPFRSGDFVDIDGHAGVVQQLTSRSTVLMGLDGNHIQIPNATVYKSTIVNYTANPNRRIDIAVGVGYDDAISEAQALIMGVLSDHPAVLAQPEPLVLAENLGSSTVDLRIYCWINASTHNILKVKSSLIRLTKRSLLAEGFSMPDSAREVIFPQGVPLSPMGDSSGATRDRSQRVEHPEPDAVATAAEGGLTSGDEDIREQARAARPPEEGRNLLDEES